MQQMVDTAEAEGSPPEPQTQGRGGKFKVAWLFKFSMAHLREHPSSNKATPPKSYQTVLPTWGSSMQTHEPMGAIHIQATKGILSLPHLCNILENQQSQSQGKASSLTDISLKILHYKN